MPYRRRGRKKQMNNIKKIIQQTIEKNIETKQVDTALAGQSIQDAGRAPYDQSLVNISGGTGSNGRNGNQVNVSGFYGKFVLTGADTTNIVRIVLYIPKADVADNLTTDAIGVTSLIDQDRYTVLYDKYFTLNALDQKMFVLARKWNRGVRKGIQVQYSGTAGTTVTKNYLKLYMVSDSAAISDPTVNGNYRLYYKDG